MSWQTAVVLMVVALAAIYVVRRTWRTWTAAKDGCGGGCGCQKAPKSIAESNGTHTFVPVEQLTVRPPGARSS
jgi:hypothetical protein